MSKPAVMEAIHTMLFSHTTLRNLTGDRMYYARGPISSEFPQVVYFDVSSTNGYLLDYNSETIQVSVWANDEFTALNISESIHSIFNRFHGIINTVNINYIELIDRGALPQEDQQLKGQFLRYQIRYRGTNLGG